jgi:hypothetical protein
MNMQNPVYKIYRVDRERTPQSISDIIVLYPIQGRTEGFKNEKEAALWIENNFSKEKTYTVLPMYHGGY